METFTGYLDPRSNKSTKAILWGSEGPASGGWQRSCDIIKGICSTL